MYKREHAVAYLFRKMPYHYFVYKRILTELKARVPELKKPEGELFSVLDYGAGLGSGLWAAQDVF